jgi:hypothetical protein
MQARKFILHLLSYLFFHIPVIELIVDKYSTILESIIIKKRLIFFLHSIFIKKKTNFHNIKKKKCLKKLQILILD